MEHELKILPEYFEEVKRRNKTFELREDNKNYKVGDTLRLLEFDNEHYTGRECRRTILYILKNVEKYGLKEGFVILAMK
ncbi:DUF3850 domain-containing protein [uncultured Arcticibacterium sp.]|uniref:DUF3850 domain-containing protein n=1 Tax=uncultured Arcticibacterium sp. TaxID=2173042 RepID=UPI0030FB3C79